MRRVQMSVASSEIVHDQAFLLATNILTPFVIEKV
jgi:hypothetical protein